MANLYGIVKIDVAAITDANVQYLRDTDLGLSMGTSSTASTSITQKGEAATLSAATPGSGYTIGKGRVLVQTASTGSGTGLRVMADILPSAGALRANPLRTIAPCRGSVEQIMTHTAYFDDFQSRQYILGGSFPLAFILDGAIPFTGVSGSVASTTSGAGTGAKFFVTAKDGMITKIVPDNSNLGTGYVAGDIITIGRAAYVTANEVVNGGTGYKGAGQAAGDISIVLQPNDVTGGIVDLSTVVILNGGSGHAATDRITLTEEDTPYSTGTGNVQIATVGTSASTQGPNVIYPTGVYVTSATAQDVEIKDTMGNSQILGQMQPGVIRPIAFSEIVGAGTTAAVGEVTIVYGDH